MFILSSNSITLVYNYCNSVPQEISVRPLYVPSNFHFLQNQLGVTEQLDLSPVQIPTVYSFQFCHFEES